MYVTFAEVVLVEDQAKIQSSDPVVYLRELRGKRVLTARGQK